MKPREPATEVELGGGAITITAMLIRHAEARDKTEWLRLRHALWDDADLNDLEQELEAHLEGKMPIIAFVLDRGDGRLGGFLEASIRPWAEGCTAPNVGYVEGWYVDPDLRGQGHGRVLVEAAEEWAREHGCTEMGSDAYLDNSDGRAAHRALGYEERSVNVHFRKLLKADDEKLCSL